MEKKNLLIKLFAVVTAMMCALGVHAQAYESYTCYTPENTTLTFYFDNQRSSRTGTTYDLNTDTADPDWVTDGTNANVTKVVFDRTFAAALPTTTYSWFYNMSNLQSITSINNLNTTMVTNMGFMFDGCSQLTSIDLKGFSTINVTKMQGMFFGCSSLTSLNLCRFNTSNVTNMNNMFRNCSNLRTIYVSYGWRTEAVTSSTNMFNGCTSLVGGEGTAWNASNPMDKTYAHIDGGTSNPGYLTHINTLRAYACYTSSNTTLTFYYDDQRGSRSGTTYDLNTSGTNPDWATDGTKSNVTQAVFDPSFADARPTTTYAWFYQMVHLQSIEGLSYLNTDEVTDMSWMFSSCLNLTSLDVSQFNTSKVTDMGYMFNGCTTLTSLDLSNFITSQVTDMGYMFNSCRNMQTIYVGDGWSTEACTFSGAMFKLCNVLVGGQGTTWNSSNPTDKTYAHIDDGPSNPGYFTEKPKEAYACYTPSNTTMTFYYDTQRSNRPGRNYYLKSYNDPIWLDDGTVDFVTHVVFDPSFADARPTTTRSWFNCMVNLESIEGLSYLNTSEVTNMSNMFTYCAKLTSLDLSSFNTSQVTNMQSMFHGCYRLESLDLSGFNTSNVTNMSALLVDCSRLTSLDLSSFNTSQVTNMGNMFNGCSNLRTIYVGNNWSTAAVTSSLDMFIYCNSLVGGQGTTWNSSNPMDKTYAHIDGGPSNPGYFTAKTGKRGDINGDGTVNVADVTALIQIVLNSSPVDLSIADLDNSGTVNVADVTALIRIILDS